MTTPRPRRPAAAMGVKPYASGQVRVEAEKSRSIAVRLRSYSSTSMSPRASRSSSTWRAEFACSVRCGEVGVVAPVM